MSAELCFYKKFKSFRSTRWSPLELWWLNTLRLRESLTSSTSTGTSSNVSHEDIHNPRILWKDNLKRPRPLSVMNTFAILESRGKTTSRDGSSGVSPWWRWSPLTGVSEAHPALSRCCSSNFCNNSFSNKCVEYLGIFVCCSSFNLWHSCIDVGTYILNSGDRPFLRVGGEDELGRWKGPQGTRALLLVRGILQGGTIRTSGPV